MLSCLLNNNRINCYDYDKDTLKKWANKNILICPACGKPYEYCHGKIISPYFRHKDKEECIDRYSEAETEEHKIGKQDLYEWIKKQDGVTDVILEGWIAETKQRPDIMFKYNGEQYVIEFQCSPIVTEYYERHELYKASGIKDIWICGVEKYIQFYHKGNGVKKVTELEKESKLYYNYKIKCFYQIENMVKYTFDEILKSKNNYYLMRNIYDYKQTKLNYLLIKDELKSYTSYKCYPSPTKRPSRKYPYPVTCYNFNVNYSLGRCLKIGNVKLKEIK